MDVKPGFARNYLLPKGFAVTWTRGGEKQIDQIRAARVARELHSLEDAQALKAKIESSPVKLTVKAGKEGRLFGSVTVGDVAEALSAVAGESVDKRTVVIGNPIKSLGAHHVSVRLHDEVSATVALNVVPA